MKKNVNTISLILLVYELILDAVFGLGFYYIDPTSWNWVIMFFVALFEILGFITFDNYYNYPEYYED